MSWIRSGRCALSFAMAVLCLLVLLPEAARGQVLPRPGPVQTRFGAGYVANAPSELLGAAVYLVVPVLGGLGVYADAKLDHDSPAGRENFVDTLTVVYAEGEEDLFVQAEETWVSFNAAVLRPLTRELTAYVGAGFTQRTRYRQYFDPDLEHGRAGHYWVEDPDGSGDGVNFMAGALLRLGSRVNFQFGGETSPRGFTVGLSLAFPPSAY